MADQQLISDLWACDEANALTNRAAREIERLENRLQHAVNERNEAWLKLEENGLDTGHAVNLQD